MKKANEFFNDDGVFDWASFFKEQLDRSNENCIWLNEHIKHLVDQVNDLHSQLDKFKEKL